MKKLRKVPDGVFDEIVFNAIDFAKRSVAELKRSPKYSMIHFAAAVELFLKARLLKEHWSLVVTRPETASLPDFRSGKFHSVSMEEAIKRLRNVANEPISDDAEKAFRALADHRNRLIHFYHPVLTSSAKARELEDIASDEYKAWHFLYELVAGSWAEHFNGQEPHHSRLKYVEGQFTPLSKPFKTKAAAEKARLKYPERERRQAAVGVSPCLRFTSC